MTFREDIPGVKSKEKEVLLSGLWWVMEWGNLSLLKGQIGL